MSLQGEREAERARALLGKPDVIEAMRIRCEETDHDWEPGMTWFFQIIRVCKWCGEKRP